MFLLKLVLTNIKYRQIIPQSYETQERLYPAEKSNKFSETKGKICETLPNLITSPQVTTNEAVS